MPKRKAIPSTNTGRSSINHERTNFSNHQQPEQFKAHHHKHYYQHEQEQDVSAQQNTIHMITMAALETWCHQLLYIRRIYPSDSFANSYFLGVRCKVNRHPGVVNYISQAVQVAVPALLLSVDTTPNHDPNRALVDAFSLEVVVDSLDAPPPSHRPQQATDPDQKTNGSTAASTAPKETTIARKDHRQLSSQNPSTRSKEETKQSQTPLPPPPSSTTALSRLDQSQHSMSSLSTTAAHPTHSQQSDEGKSVTFVEDKGISKTDAQNKERQDTSRKSNSMSLPQEEEEDETQSSTLLQNKSVQVLEKFSLLFSHPYSANRNGHIADMEDIGRMNSCTTLDNSIFTAQSVQATERAFRNLILHLSNLKRDRVAPVDSLSFKLVLHIRQANNCTNKKQPTTATSPTGGSSSGSSSLEKALDAGMWYPCSTETQVMAEARNPCMPLYQVEAGPCNIQFHVQRKR